MYTSSNSWTSCQWDPSTGNWQGMTSTCIPRFSPVSQRKRHGTVIVWRADVSSWNLKHPRKINLLCTLVVGGDHGGPGWETWGWLSVLSNQVPAARDATKELHFDPRVWLGCSTMISQELVCISDSTFLDLRWHDCEMCQGNFRIHMIHVCPVPVW